MYMKPKEKWIIEWKKSRNHRGKAEVYNEVEAIELMNEKKDSGFKVKMKKGG